MRPQHEKVDIAKSETFLLFQGTVELEVTVCEHPTKSTFFVSEKTNDPLILGYIWIKEQRAVYDRPRKCVHACKN